MFVASEPNNLALADDGSRVYVASNTTNFVTPFSLSTMTPGTPFPIGDPHHRVDGHGRYTQVMLPDWPSH